MCGLLLSAQAVRAQGCNKKCKAELKDAQGCCPASKAPHKASAPAPIPVTGLQVTSDVPVALVIDGVELGHVEGNQPQRFPLAPGVHQVLARSDVEGIEFRSPVTVAATGDTQLGILLQAEIRKKFPMPDDDSGEEEAAPAASGPQVKPGDFVMVAELDSEPRVKEKAELVIPETAKLKPHSGIIVVLANIDEHGVVTEAALMRGINNDMGINQAAVDAAKKTKFTPGIKQGVPVKTAKSLTYKIVSQ